MEEQSVVGPHVVLVPAVFGQAPRLKPRTEANVLEAFIGEAQAVQRLLAYAARAQREQLPQIAALFRAVAASEGVHARRHFSLLERVSDTQANLEQAFQSERSVNGVHYTRMLREAVLDRERRAALVFSQVRDVEELHERMYKRALENLLEEREVDYHLCGKCGYLVEDGPVEPCPVCGLPADRFVLIAT